jgi:hypothetical protein
VLIKRNNSNNNNKRPEGERAARAFDLLQAIVCAYNNRINPQNIIKKKKKERKREREKEKKTRSKQKQI